MFIIATIPVGRYVQKFIYQYAGKSFFTYAVLFVIGSVFVATLYALMARLKTGWLPRYIWIVACAGVYAFTTLAITDHPEEAVHFLEFGLLAYFLFRALSYKIHDWTVYLSTIFLILLAGTLSEFLQWLIPGRFWDFMDIGYDTLSGCIFVIAVWKGIQPEGVGRDVRKTSVRLLVNIVTVDLIILGFCLLNTPETVHFYTGIFTKLSWLRAEEPMSEFRYPFVVWGGVPMIVIMVRALGEHWMKRLEQ